MVKQLSFHFEEPQAQPIEADMTQQNQQQPAPLELEEEEKPKISGPSFIVTRNPATLQALGKIEISSPDWVQKKYQEAKKAFPAWASLSFEERASYLLRAKDYILEHLDEIAQAISEDNGKPRVEALSSDIFPVCEMLEYFAKNAEKILKPQKISIGLMALLGRRSSLHFQALGVVGIISPWNFPFSIPMSGIAMALMAGNCVLLKPADATAMVGIKIEEIFEAAGLPKGVFSHLPGDASTGEALLDQPLDKVIFTGSVRVGKRVMQKCAERLIPCSLELGGKDPMIVCRDANLESAAAGAVWGAFCNAGQVCASVERVYVDQEVASEFTRLVVEKTKQLRVGPSTQANNDMGPLTTEAQLKIVEAQVEEARQRGARIVTGGKRLEKQKGYFYLPTVITGVDQSFKCVKEESFGPVLPIMIFKTEEEAIRLANDSEYGLTASVWTRSVRRGRELALQIRAGTVSVNECTYTFALPQTPWGGLKNSGIGRTHGKMGLQDLTHILHLHENRLSKIKDFWWFGYDGELYETLKFLCKHYTGSFFEKCKAVVRILKELRRKKY